MAEKICSAGKENVLEEIIDNATELPVESQNLVLMMAKAMRFTRECLMRQNSQAQQTGAGGDGVIL